MQDVPGEGLDEDAFYEASGPQHPSAPEPAPEGHKAMEAVLTEQNVLRHRSEASDLQEPEEELPPAPGICETGSMEFEVPEDMTEEDKQALAHCLEQIQKLELQLLFYSGLQCMCRVFAGVVSVLSLLSFPRLGADKVDQGT